MTALPAQFSIALPCFSAESRTDWQFVLARARMYDRVGVDRLVVSDHVVMGEHLDEYGRPEIGGQAGGVQPTGPDGSWLEPMTLLSVVAGATARIRLGTNILLAALRRPAVLAKASATLDVLSNGRLDLGVGVGWQREEYDAAGLAFAERGRLLDDTLAICRTLWTQQRARHQSEYLSFEGIHMMPKPTSPGGVPIWVSGTVNARVVRRLARFGAGWIPWGDAARNLETSIAGMKDELSAQGGDPEQLQIVGALPNQRRDDGSPDLAAIMAAVPRLRSIGVTDFRSWIRLPDDDDAAGELLTAAVAEFRLAAGRTDEQGS
jgi:probable F420-dependent oxidoreductase